MLYVAVYGIGNGKPYIAYVVIEPCFAVCGTDQHHVDVLVWLSVLGLEASPIRLSAGWSSLSF